jgi:hypothetical protein
MTSKGTSLFGPFSTEMKNNHALALKAEMKNEQRTVGN